MFFPHKKKKAPSAARRTEGAFHPVAYDEASESESDDESPGAV